ncbi:GntR family transcriptional regulator [Streptomyces actuosus]|uniref:GntR family transcriptional regulator n=1 Tax=Streptomyces actuosus TaxID=1885 RepID=A0ABS2VZA4_STRAS|nr:GntR family transcriptional regulator [Streptomyces actuosus]MBN0048476.1 GntR family transcriptional regulator [Streptomyces actuosus]
MPDTLRTEERISTRRTLTDEVMEKVQQMVRCGELRAGKLYSVYQLAEALGISRSPVRDGLLKLEAAGLVGFERNRGFRVTVPSARQIVEIFAIRLALEPPAVARVAAHRDPAVAGRLRQTMAAMEKAAASLDEPSFWAHDQDFHNTILTAAGNSQAATVVRDLRERTRLIGPGTTTAARSLPAVAAEHRPVLDAIAAGDGVTASARMRAHLEATGRLLSAQTAAVPSDDPGVDALWRDIVG